MVSILDKRNHGQKETQTLVCCDAALLSNIYRVMLEEDLFSDHIQVFIEARSSILVKFRPSRVTVYKKLYMLTTSGC